MNNVTVELLATKHRRASQRQEFETQTLLAEHLAKYLDPACTFWSSLENRPRSAVAGVRQKQAGVRSGLPDLFVVFRDLASASIKLVFVELKSPRGVASKKQKQIFAELTAPGVRCLLARSARAALMALHLSGVPFRHHWRQPRLHAWEGPFSDISRRLPQEPLVAAERLAAYRRYKQRQRLARARKAQVIILNEHGSTHAQASETQG